MVVILSSLKRDAAKPLLQSAGALLHTASGPVTISLSSAAFILVSVPIRYRVEMSCRRTFVVLHCCFTLALLTVADMTTLTETLVKLPQRVSNGHRYGELHFVGNMRNPTGFVSVSHGVGSSGAEWKLFAKSMHRKFPNLLFALPTAPPRYSMGFFDGMAPSAWFSSSTDVVGVKESVSYLQALSSVVCEAFDIKKTNVVYGGYDQGALPAFYAGITAAVRPKGIFSLSGFLGFANELNSLVRHRDVPFFMLEGKDDFLPTDWVEQDVEDVMALLGYKASALSITLVDVADHSSSPTEVAELTEWFRTLTWQ